MDDRTRAIAILRQAREILTERLTERILESQEQILEDARGHVYLSGIDEVYDTIGARLNHVNAMLSNLPPSEAPLPGTTRTTTATSSGDVATSSGDIVAGATVMDTTGVLFESGRGELPALPAPHGGQHQLAAPLAAPSFRTFAVQIQVGDLESAGHSLADLLSIDPGRGRYCAEAFARNLAQDSDVMAKAMSIRKLLAVGSTNSALMLLYECFGLQGMEAIHVLQTLKARFIDA